MLNKLIKVLVVAVLSALMAWSVLVLVSKARGLKVQVNWKTACMTPTAEWVTKYGDSDEATIAYNINALVRAAQAQAKEIAAIKTQLAGPPIDALAGTIDGVVDPNVSKGN